MLSKKIIVAAFLGAGFILGCSFKAAAAEKYYINAQNVNVRAAPSTQSQILDCLKYGTEIFPIESETSSGNWFCNIRGGQICYIYSKYVSYGDPKNNTITNITNSSSAVSLGVHKVTTYCSCPLCCGKGGGRVTASGTVPTVGRTVGCNWLPFGTHVLIEGHEYIIEDHGSPRFKGFDIYWGNDHNAALRSGFGRKIEVFIIK